MTICYHSTMDQYRLKSKPHNALTILLSVFFFLVLSVPTTRAQITSTGDSTTYSTSTSFNLPFILIFVALIILFFASAFCIIYFSCLRGSNPLRNFNPTTRTTPVETASQWVIPVVRQSGLDESVLETFPIIKYAEVKELNLGTLECAVCLSEYNDLDTLRILPGCCHVFHPACIDNWLSNHEVCPICRASLTNQNIMSTELQPETGNDGVIMKGTEKFTLRLPDHVLKQIEVKRGYKLSASIAGSGYQATPMSKSGRVWAFIRTFSSRRGQEVGGGSRTIRLGGSLHRNPTLGRNGSIQEMSSVQSGSVRGPVDAVASGMVLLQSGSVRDQTNTVAQSGSVSGQTDMGTSSMEPTQSDSVRYQIDTIASTMNPERCGSVITGTNRVESAMEVVLSVSESVSDQADMGDCILVPVHDFNQV